MSGFDQRFCGSCGSVIYGGYCASCAGEAEKKTDPDITSRDTGVFEPPNTVVQSSTAPYRSSIEPDTVSPSTMCENCHARPRSQETEDDGTITTHPYCGFGCFIASQRSIAPAPNVPAPAAAPIGKSPSRLLMERDGSPIRRSILFMMRERWHAEELGAPQLKSVYRIDLPGQVYRRFDLALQMKDACPVMTTYYGGVVTCNIADAKHPLPCESDSCEVCDVLCSSFGNIPYGGSSREGAYGPGLYTYRNPALAHHVAIQDNNFEQTSGMNYVLIQCRVVAQENSRARSKSLAGFLDNSGVVFCSQSTAVIPTHILIYSLGGQLGAQRRIRDVADSARHEARMDDEDAIDSTFYATDRSSYQRATRQSPHPLTGHVGDRIDRDYDEDLRSGARATVARKFLRRSEDLNSRVDEDVIDYFDQLRSFSGRGDRERYEEDERPSTRHHPHPPPQMFKGKGRR